MRTHSLATPLVVICDWLVEYGIGIKGPGDLKQEHIVRSDNTTVAATFLEYLDDRYDPESAGKARGYSAPRLFFDWWQPLNDPEAPNPLPERHQPQTGDYAGKTSKEALPVRIIEMMKAILVEDDYAFARAIPEDYVTRIDDAGNELRLWSPVRAVALQGLLTVPIRSVQLRLLDSGEYDELVFDEREWRFVANPRGIQKRRQGALRGFRDLSSDTASLVGFFINSNKSDDPARSKKLGYEIKWEHKPLIKAFAMLRDWQVNHNPTNRLVSINELSDQSLHAPEEAARRMPKYSFLFRDPASIRASSLEPVSQARLSSMFLLLLAEVERRLRSDGVETTLITKWEDRKNGPPVPVRAYVTIHSLRVSGITNFAEFGVPLNVLTEFLAGHSTILMNIWYQRLGFSTVSSIIDEAYRRMTPEAAHKQFGRWQADFVSVVEGNEVPDSRMIDRLVVNDEAAGQLYRAPAELWSIGIDGICPNGRTLCSEGGPRIGTKGGTRATPVPGGAGNCPLCRFWATGPMFIAGQIIAANLLLYTIQEKGSRLTSLSDDLEQAQSLGDREEVNRIRSSIEVLNTDLDNHLHTWAARYVALEKSLEKLNGAESGQELALLTSNDAGETLAPAHAANDTEALDEARIGFTHVGQYGLLEFVNQVCEVFPALDIPSARFKKSALLDRLIDREGGKAFFFRLSEEDALKTGNQFTRFLTRAASYTALSELLAGETTLSDVGLGSIDQLISDMSHDRNLESTPPVRRLV